MSPTCFSICCFMRAEALNRLEDFRESSMEGGKIMGGSPAVAAEVERLHVAKYFQANTQTGLPS